jgi:hypothetical protein
MAYSIAFGTVASNPGLSLAAASPGLTGEEVRLLRAIVEVLAPCGTGNTTCVDSFERKLRGSSSRFLPAFRQGLAAIDLACRTKTNRGLLDLDQTERRWFVRQLRSGHKLTAFFSLLTCSLA